ncbi:C40 family peptidase [Flavobacteriaceae bacterium 14752]|uniref:C40 family peptidase n=1 Tax=Mesohalobacter salilacus TaxID=2491711 RepID=UPI000F642A78|nr:NlpC/P60 family protein [Flavobacteriaceae bacterium 14752]
MVKYNLIVKGFIIFLIFSLTSCGGSKRLAQNTKAQQISTYAKSFLGTSYKYGGTNSSGMDCSGLVYRAFYRHGIELPRTSKSMSKIGKKTRLKKAKVGDLVFFKTPGKGGRINHVGLVIKADGRDVRFIHSTTSQGVIVTNLNQKYWKKSFKFVKRVL